MTFVSCPHSTPPVPLHSAGGAYANSNRSTTVRSESLIPLYSNTEE